MYRFEISIVSDFAVLRVPVLYGEAEYLGEGAVDIILKQLLDTTVEHQLSSGQRRYPTHTDDVASVIQLLLNRYFQVQFTSCYCKSDTLSVKDKIGCQAKDFG